MKYLIKKWFMEKKKIMALLLVFIVQRYRRSLTEKDTEILYREELFSTLSGNVDDIFARFGL